MRPVNHIWPLHYPKILSCEPATGHQVLSAAAFVVMIVTGAKLGPVLQFFCMLCLLQRQVAGRNQSTPLQLQADRQA